MSGRVASFAWVALLVFTLGTLSLLSSPSSTSPRSAVSIEKEGRRAWFELVGRVGFEPELWAQPPGELGRGDGILFLHAVPPEPIGYGLTGGEDGGERSIRRARDPQHYRSFIEEGGCLVVPRVDGMADFVQATLGVEFTEHLALVGLEDTTDPLRVVGGPEPLTLAGDELEVFERLPARSPWRALATFEDGRSLAVRLELGRGDLVLLSSDRFLENASIGRGDNALAGVRLLEALGHGPRVLFDEYALGAWDPPTPVELALSPKTATLSLHLAAACLLLLWWAARSGAFPREPRGLPALSPLVRARGFANLMLRAHRFEQLAGMLRRGVLHRLLPPARRSVQGDVLTPAEVERLLEGLGLSADPDTLGRWKRALCSRPASDLSELESLAGELAELEQEALVAEVERGNRTRVGEPAGRRAPSPSV